MAKLEHLQHSDLEEVISLAKSYREKERSGGMITLGTDRAEALVDKILSNDARPEFDALVRKLGSLDRDSFAECLALAWIGREHDESPRLNVHLKQARESIDRDPDVVSYLATKIGLDRYLRDGLLKAGVGGA